MRALVTGGAGFIGSNLVDRLLAEGHDVDVVDDLSTGSLANLADARRSPVGRLTFHQIDIRSSAMDELMKRSRPQVVFHLAASSDSGAHPDDPLRDAEIDVMGSLRVLEAARRCGTQKIVFASSGRSIYGAADPKDLPLKESHPQRPVTPQGVAKRAVATYLELYRELHSLEFTVLALSNVYGPRQSRAPGGGVISDFAGALSAGRDCTIHGRGTQSRDFLYVDDAVDAFARAAERGGGLTLNVGTGKETTIRDLYAVMAASAGVDRPASHSPAPAEELVRWSLDPGRAAIHLGWRPWTPVEEGVSSVLEWWRASARREA